MEEVGQCVLQMYDRTRVSICLVVICDVCKGRGDQNTIVTMHLIDVGYDRTRVNTQHHYTYLSGWVDQHHFTYLGGWKGQCTSTSLSGWKDQHHCVCLGGSKPLYEPWRVKRSTSLNVTGRVGGSALCTLVEVPKLQF